jgi:hypothetical protein
MRLLPLTIISVLFSANSLAQTADQGLSDRCAPITTQLSANSNEGQLFLATKVGWIPIEKSSQFLFFKQGGHVLPEYKNGNRLHFLYAAPRSASAYEAGLLRYLAVKTRSLDIRGGNLVYLRRQRRPDYFQPGISTYQAYHRGETDEPRPLRRYHDWGAGNRSDRPLEVRGSYLFDDEGNFPSSKGFFNTPARNSIKRVLSISYKASAERTTCVPFVLGPNLAAYGDQDVDGDSEVQLDSSFAVDVVEAGTANKFTVWYKP